MGVLRGKSGEKSRKRCENMGEFTGKTAWVTGAGGYIGGETAFALAAGGAKVAVCDISEEAVEKTLSRILAAGGEARGYVTDVTDSASVNGAAEKIAAELGGIDIAVHVAGGSARIAGKNARYVPLTEQEDYVIDRVLKVNLYGAMYVSRAAARVMIGQGRGGKIVNFSSIVGLNGLKTCCDYAAAKGGVISFTKSLAKELGEYGINVNSVAPGVVARPGEDGNTEYVYGSNFLHKKCLASDVAGLVAFLVSEKANFITGQAYVIDGGRSLAMKGSD